LKIRSTIFFCESGFVESGLNHRRNSRKPKLATHGTDGQLLLTSESRVKACQRRR